MDRQINALMMRMIDYSRGDAPRIQHFLKVYAYARSIGLAEELPADVQCNLEAAAILHDVGIRESLRKYGSAQGLYQQIEGPPIARDMLRSLGFPELCVERVCFLIAHHHTLTGVDGPDYRILLEADALVNLVEEGASPAEAAAARETVFATPAGLSCLAALFPDL